MKGREEKEKCTTFKLVPSKSLKLSKCSRTNQLGCNTERDLGIEMAGWEHKNMGGKEEKENREEEEGVFFFGGMSWKEMV